MQHNGGTHPSVTFRLILAFSLIVVFILSLSVLGQQTQPTRLSATGTITPSPTPSRTPSPTATRTPTPTLPPSTSTLADINPSKLFTLGRGIMSPVVRSPDGRLIAIVDNGTLKWFDAVTFEQLGDYFMGENPGGTVVFSPDGRWVVNEDYFGGILFNLQEQGTPESICNSHESCGGFAFSPDGGFIAYTSYDRTTGGPYYAIGVWNIAGHQHVSGYLPTLQDFRYHTMSPPAFSADSRLVAAGHSDGRVYVWNTRDGETRFILEGHAGSVINVDFSPDGLYLASGSADGTVRLWSPSSGQLLRVITGFLSSVTEVHFSADSRQLRIGVSKQADQIYDLISGQLTTWEEPEPATDPFVTAFYGQGYIEDGMATRVAFNPDGRSLALGRGSILVWNLATQELVTPLDLPRSVIWMTYSPDGRRLGVINDAGDVLVWDTSSWELLLSLSTEILPAAQVFSGSGLGLNWGLGAGVYGEQGFAFSPDGTRLAVGNGTAIEVWDIQGASLLYTLEETTPIAYATRLSYASDGQRIYAVLNRNRDAAIWDADSGVLINRLDLPGVDLNAFTTTDLNGALFTRNNSDEQTNWIEIWDLDTGEFVRVDSPGRETEPLRFSPDGSLLLSVNADRLYVWKTESGGLIYRSPDDLDVGSLAISPDNTRLAIGSYGVAEIWDISGIADRSRGSYVITEEPQPTDERWSDLRPESSHMGDITATPQPSPELPEDATFSANAAQVTETGRFGAGRVTQVSWAHDSQSVVVAGSWGVDQYSLQTTGDLFGEPVHYATDLWVTSSVTLTDGRSLAAGTDGERVQVWDLTSDAMLVDLEGGGEPALSPDGQLLVYLGEDRALHTWDLAAGGSLATLLGYAHHPVFSPDSKLVAAVIAGWFERDSIRVWDATTGAIVNALGGLDNTITDLSFSPDGQRIIAAAGGSAWAWDIRPGQPVINTQLYPGEIDWNLTLYIHTVTAAALSPDGWTLAVGSSENTIGLYSLGNQNPTRLLNGHSAAIEQLAFSPNGRLLLSRDADGAVLLWNVSTGELIDALYSYYGEVRGLVFQENGDLIGWQAGTTWTFDPAAGEVLHTTQIYSGTILAVSPLGDWLAATYPYQVSLWDAQTGEFRQTLGEEAPKPFVEYYWEGELFQGYHGAAFSPDGSLLVVLGSGGALIFTTEDGIMQRMIEGNNNAQQADISNDNRWLLSPLYAHTNPPLMFDLHSGEYVFALDGQGYQNIQYRISPDNRWVGVVFRAQDGFQFQLWDIASHTLLKTLNFSEEIPLLSLAFSPDSRMVALGQADGQIFLLDLSTSEIVATLSGHRGPIEHLAFSPDGMYLASAGQDGTIRIWAIP